MWCSAWCCVILCVVCCRVCWAVWPCDAAWSSSFCFTRAIFRLILSRTICPIKTNAISTNSCTIYTLRVNKWNILMIARSSLFCLFRTRCCFCTLSSMSDSISSSSCCLTRSACSSVRFSCRINLLCSSMSRCVLTSTICRTRIGACRFTRCGWTCFCGSSATRCSRIASWQFCGIISTRSSNNLIVNCSAIINQIRNFRKFKFK